MIDSANRSDALSTSKNLDLLAFILLPLLICLVYFPVTSFTFISIDDPQFTHHPLIRSGLSLQGIEWAFTSFYASFWIPLNWISHMAAFELFGNDPGWHHAVNVALHAIATLLLYCVLSRSTTKHYQSFFVAALFALHPLAVESVAWVTERKDVLSMIFFLGALWCYTYYTQRKSRSWLIAALVVYTLGCMVKPMLVTFPLVLILWDYWPLRRIDATAKSIFTTSMIKEKLPFFLVAAVFSWVTIAASSVQGGASRGLEIDLIYKLANAAQSIIQYIYKIIYPHDMAILYPHPGETINLMVAFVAFMIILAAIMAAWSIRKEAPYVLFGVLFFCVTLLPVLGLLQAGWQSMADRFTYLPRIGVFIIAAWGTGELTRKRPAGRSWVVLGACCLVVWFAAISHAQLYVWTNSYSVLRHAAMVTEDNGFVHIHLHSLLLRDGYEEEAEHQYTLAAEGNPLFVSVYHSRLAVAHLAKGDHKQALDEINIAIALTPRRARAWNNKGVILAFMDKKEEAIKALEKSLELEPDNPAARNSLEALRAE